VVGATVWSAALVTAAPALDSGLPAHALHVSPRGAILGAVAFIRDISETRRKEAVRRDFVANVSHELRTPLAAIRGYAELARREEDDTEGIAHALRRVESESARMTTLVDDLLLLARLDSGRPLSADEVDLTLVVMDAVSDARVAGPTHRWQLDLPEEPVTTIGDSARLHQVLANLLANARTHTPAGTTVWSGLRTEPGVSVRPCASTEAKTQSAARSKMRSPPGTEAPSTNSENVIVATPASRTRRRSRV